MRRIGIGGAFMALAVLLSMAGTGAYAVGTQGMNLLLLQGYANSLNKTSVNAGEFMDSVTYSEGKLEITEMKVDTGVFALSNPVIASNRYTTPEGLVVGGEHLTRTARAKVTVTKFNSGSSWYGLGLYFGNLNGEPVFLRIEQGGFLSCYEGNTYRNGADLPSGLEKNRAYEISAEVTGRRAVISLDGTRLLTLTFSGDLLPAFGIASCGASGFLEELYMGFAEEILPPIPDYRVDALGEGGLEAAAAAFDGRVFRSGGGREDAVFETLCAGLEEVWRKRDGDYEKVSVSEISSKVTMAVELDRGVRKLGILVREELEILLEGQFLSVLESGRELARYELVEGEGACLFTAVMGGDALTLIVNGSLLCYGLPVGAHPPMLGFRTYGGEDRVLGISYRYPQKIFAEKPVEETYPRPLPPGEANQTPDTTIPDYVPSQTDGSGCKAGIADYSGLAAALCLAGAGMSMKRKGE